MYFDSLEELVKTYLPKSDIEKIKNAYLFAEIAHQGQMRRSGELYISHPVEVAKILANLHMDPITITAALLHDVVEDTGITLEQVNEKFGTEVAHLVDGITKLGKIKYQSKEELQAENHRKMFIAMAQDIRVILIKLADRLHNMRTIRYMSEEQQKQKAEETLEIFAPLAHRLGISAIRWELEDISLRILNPQQYYRIANLMKKKRIEREKIIEMAIKSIKEKLLELNIEGEVSGRAKHIYSIYRKMTLQNKEFNEIYDLLAVRVIVDNIRDCYGILGLIHTLWKPMPGRFKDYIAMPKANMYQSLHTTVIGPNGEPLEIQIRTWEMHRISEYGIAAHWAYKEGKEVTAKSFENKLQWFREILEWQQEFRDARDFMESLKVDLFSDVVFVFTPKGDVVELPAGSVPLDFAYRIHTEIGNKTIGAKVNGKIVPLDYTLKTGDIIEILTSKHSYGPSQDWLKIAKSSHAKGKIRQWFKKERREENIQKGKEALEKEIKRLGFAEGEWLTNENLEKAAEFFHFPNIEDMLAAISYGGITAAQVVNKITEKARKEELIQTVNDLKDLKPLTTNQKVSLSSIKVEGIDNLMVRFSKCCNPVPGDKIVGFITRGRGISIHRANCNNIKLENRERLIEVEWDLGKSQLYDVDIEVIGHDRRGLLNEVLQTISESKTNLVKVSGRADKNKMAYIDMTVSINNLEHLNSLVDKIKRIKDIYTVKRLMQ